MGVDLKKSQFNEICHLLNSHHKCNTRESVKRYINSSFNLTRKRSEREKYIQTHRFTD